MGKITWLSNIKLQTETDIKNAPPANFGTVYMVYRSYEYGFTRGITYTLYIWSFSKKEYIPVKSMKIANKIFMRQYKHIKKLQRKENGDK